jgi:hypothetical protein
MAPHLAVIQNVQERQTRELNHGMRVESAQATPDIGTLMDGSGEAAPALRRRFGPYIFRGWIDIHGGTPSELETFDVVAYWQLALKDNQRATTSRRSSGAIFALRSLSDEYETSRRQV